MTLKRCLNYGLVFIITLSFAMADIKADDPAEGSYYPYDVYDGHTAEELAFVAALNAYRAERGLHPVGLNGGLSGECRRWSSQMRKRGHLSHDPTGGTEIIAHIAYESGERALYVWQRSPAHNAVLLSARIDTIGIGSDGIWWTMRGRQNSGERVVVYTTNTESEEAETEEEESRTSSEVEMIGRVPMGVLESRYSPAGDISRRANILTSFRSLFR